MNNQNLISATARRLPFAAALLLSTALLGSACMSEQPALDLNDDGDTGYLFGLSAQDIADTADYYGVDSQAALDAMRAPLECARFGDLCANGELAARELLAQTWSMALERESTDIMQGAYTELRSSFADADDKVSTTTDEVSTTTNKVSNGGYSDYQYGSSTYRIVVNASITNLVLFIQHDSTVKHKRYNAAAGEWVDNVTTLTSDVNGERTVNGAVVATHHWCYTASASILEHSYTMTNAGHTSLQVCGTANGHNFCRSTNL